MSFKDFERNPNQTSHDQAPRLDTGFDQQDLSLVEFSAGLITAFGTYELEGHPFMQLGGAAVTIALLGDAWVRYRRPQS